uniref:Uncharacterized protein n=1 Tax=Rhizophora mucronata TaxID=61149 RepID=A0A2P2PDQ4_RHIMU
MGENIFQKQKVKHKSISIRRQGRQAKV